jgi:hypothetical protein
MRIQVVETAHDAFVENIRSTVNIPTTVAMPQHTITENGPKVEEIASSRSALRADLGIDFRYA